MLWNCKPHSYIFIPPPVAPNKKIYRSWACIGIPLPTLYAK